MISTVTKGLFRPGQTLLHRIDPRLKVLSCLLLIGLCFSSTSWTQLILLVVFLSFAAWLGDVSDNSILRLSWMLRWLLLFTLLMHFLMSPGRTLWGISWLSLDGLLQGLMVCAQMLVAVVVAALLAMFTSTAQLAGAFGWFVQPLGWLGCRTDEWQKILLLALDFVPIVQEEIVRAAVIEEAGDAGRHEHASPGWSARWFYWMQRLHAFLLRLFDRCDLIAHDIVTDNTGQALPQSLSSLMPLALHDQLFSVTITLLVACFWLVW